MAAKKSSTIASLVVKINGDNSGLRSELKATERAIDRAFPKESQAFGGAIIKGASAAAAALGAIGLASVKMAADMETSRIAFTSMLGSAQKADKFLRDLAKFASKTPFDMPGLIDASQRMLALGFNSKEIIPTLTAIGDAVAAVGGNSQTLDRVTTAFGQMKTAGRVTAQDMNQLVNANIPAWEMLAKAAGKSVAEIRDLVSKGAVDSTAAIEIMTKEMNSRFGGMMRKQNQTVTGIMANIQDAVAGTMVAIGKDITEAFELKEVLNGALAQIEDFRGKVEAVGLRKTMLDQVPAEAFAASVGIISLSITGKLIPALFKGLAAVKLFLKGIGPLGWAIAGAMAAATHIAIASENEHFKTYQSLKERMPASEITPEMVRQETSIRQIGKGEQQMSNYLNDSIEKLKETEENANKAAAALIGGAGKAGGSVDKLSEKIQNLSKSIHDEWVQTTHTQLEQLDVWHEEQLKALDDTKNANINYQQDLLKVEATYSERRRKIIYEEYADRVNIAREAADRIKALEDQRTKRNLPKVYNSSGGVETSSVSSTIQDIATSYRDQVESISRYYDDLTAKFASASNQQKEDYIKAWTEAKYAFELNAEGIVSFAKQANEEILNAEADKIEKLKAFNADYLLWREEMDSAYNSGNIEKAIEQINSEQSLLQQDLEGRQEYIDEYYSWWKEAHRSAMSYMAEGYNALGKGMQNSLAGIFDGTMSIDEAWRSLGQTMVSTIAQMAAKWITSRIMIGLMGETLAGGEAAMSAGLAASTAAAWAPAAAAVSLASFGANSGPAMAGITATHALSASFSVLGFATGGYVSGAGTSTSDSIPAMLSDGEYVINAKATAEHLPLIAAINNGRLPKFASGGFVTGPSLSSMSISGGNLAALPALKNNNITEQNSQSFNFNISALDGKSVERVLRKNGSALVRSLSDQAAIFNTGKLRPV